jgi:hypothetical protein
MRLKANMCIWRVKLHGDSKVVLVLNSVQRGESKHKYQRQRNTNARANESKHNILSLTNGERRRGQEVKHKLQRTNETRNSV